jgi:hypothetical protein
MYSYVLKSKDRELVTTWNFRSFHIKVTWKDENIMFSFKKLLSWNNTKLQATTQFTINLQQLLWILVFNGLLWHDMVVNNNKENKNNVFEPSLAQAVKLLRSNLCQKLLGKFNLRCSWKLPCSKIDSIPHLTVESDNKAKCSWLADYNDWPSRLH